MRTVSAILLLVTALGAWAVEHEFYWDNGVPGGSYAFNFAARYYVVFDEELTGGRTDGVVTRLGVYTRPNWPDSTYQGCYLFVINNTPDGYPGDELVEVYAPGIPGQYSWVDVNVQLSDSTFWVGWKQIGLYPACDAISYDSNGGTGHSWHPGPDGWLPYDLMLRCYWEDGEVTIRESTWGRIKNLW
ncbi:MAG TPA: hypothetical protein VM054_02370 [bacterium]|nr:hypothetical protein [bacterium]